MWGVSRGFTSRDVEEDSWSVSIPMSTSVFKCVEKQLCSTVNCQMFGNIEQEKVAHCFFTIDLFIVVKTGTITSQPDRTPSRCYWRPRGRGWRLSSTRLCRGRCGAVSWPPVSRGRSSSRFWSPRRRQPVSAWTAPSPPPPEGSSSVRTWGNIYF